MKIFENYNLKYHNTFKINVFAKRFISIDNEEDFIALNHYIDLTNDKYFILGRGSNVLFRKDYNHTIIQVNLKGVKLIKNNIDDVLISFSAGEEWHNIVMLTNNLGYYGLENLASIPGNVGAAAVQNIGAYGVEQSDLLEYVEVFKDSNFKTLPKSELKYGYRHSLFKEKDYKNYIITNVVYRLYKSNDKVNLSYSELKKYFIKNNIDEVSPKNILNAVIKIRQSKLPDPNILPNAGSFFKNPVISKEKLTKLLNQYPELPSFRVNDEEFKVSAAFLIEKLGFKGFKFNNVGVFDNHSLILCNYNNGSGEELFELSEIIIEKCFKEFEIELEREVIVV